MEKNQFIKEVLPLRQNLLNYTFQILKDKDEAEDIVQEVLLRLWNIRHTLTQYNSIEALSIHISKNLCLNRLKIKQRTQQDTDNIVIASQTPTPHMELEQKDKVRQVMRIIGQLPDIQQSILKMKHIEGLEVDEIAELTGSKPEAIRMNLSRARRRVKDIFFKIERR